MIPPLELGQDLGAPAGVEPPAGDHRVVLADLVGLARQRLALPVDQLEPQRTHDERVAVARTEAERPGRVFVEEGGHGLPGVAPFSANRLRMNCNASPGSV
ncbi:hypothetical protein SAMN02745121_08429 [Nannocystis exedens]|uniref:Uncharacterized protein n=1 Tax=Nannocystis exedens TaxID=54 RepID=A0A1I2I892_9BACT|nr:hypothetical protein NAEX_07742 [Nannocystis exedens]SFF37096.1 hypothetical protein SAMN02745121_08429 [Nannocystis exedens]